MLSPLMYYDQSANRGPSFANRSSKNDFEEFFPIDCVDSRFTSAARISVNQSAHAAEGIARPFAVVVSRLYSQINRSPAAAEDPYKAGAERPIERRLSRRTTGDACDSVPGKGCWRGSQFSFEMGASSVLRLKPEQASIEEIADKPKLCSACSRGTAFL